MRLRMSELGQDFPRERFVSTPVSTIRKALAVVEQEEQRKANISAYTVANLTQLVLGIAHGFSGSKGRPPSVKAKDFLPFPDWQPHTKEGKRNLDSSTRFVLTKLQKENRIPAYVFVSLMTPVEPSR